MARVEGEKGGRGEARGRRAFRRVCSKQPPAVRTCGHCVVLPHPVSPEITVTCTRSVRRTTPAGQAHQTTNLHGRLWVPSGDCRLGSPIGRFGIRVGHAGRPDPVSFIPSVCAAGMAGPAGLSGSTESRGQSVPRTTMKGKLALPDSSEEQPIRQQWVGTHTCARVRAWVRVYMRACVGVDAQSVVQRWRMQQKARPDCSARSRRCRTPSPQRAAQHGPHVS